MRAKVALVATISRAAPRRAPARQQGGSSETEPSSISDSNFRSMRPLLDLLHHKTRYGAELIPFRRIAGVTADEGRAMHAFIRRFLLHYGIYRRYPLRRLTAACNAWRAARA
jgi:hypothetical protein